MAGAFLLTATFEHVSGFPEDRVVNTFPITFDAAGSPTDAQRNAAMAAVVEFYNGANTTDDVAGYLSRELSRVADASIVRMYDIGANLDGSPHGSPIDSASFTLAVNNNVLDLPAEMAVVLTTRANGWQAAAVETPDGVDPGTAVDRPRQRLSGRNFIGPLNVGTQSTATTTIRVATAFVTDLLDAGEALFDSLNIAEFSWGVWSRVAQAVEPLTHLQVDNAFDVMRKRGPDPTVRTTRAL